MNNEITLLVADDHPMLLKGLVDELKNHNYNVVETANNGAQALEKIIEFKPSIALLDVEMPLLTGFEVIQKCKEKEVDTKFIILTSHKEKGFVLKAKQLNIMGYILKDEPFVEVQNCIQSVSKGKAYFSKVFNSVLDQEVSPQLQKIKFLSPSERIIIRLMAQGLTSKEISEKLFVSVRTVEKHRSNIISKLGLPKGIDALTNWVQDNREIIMSL